MAVVAQQAITITDLNDGLSPQEAAEVKNKADAAWENADIAGRMALEAGLLAAEGKQQGLLAADQAWGINTALIEQINNTTSLLQSMIQMVPDQIMAQVSALYITKLYELDELGQETADEIDIRQALSQLYLTSNALTLSLLQREADHNAFADSVSTDLAWINETLTVFSLEPDGLHIGVKNQPTYMRLSNNALEFFVDGVCIAEFDGADNHMVVNNAKINQLLEAAAIQATNITVNKSLYLGTERWTVEPTGGISLTSTS